MTTWHFFFHFHGMQAGKNDGNGFGIKCEKEVSNLKNV
jgi:hypothetical protein